MSCTYVRTRTVQVCPVIRAKRTKVKGRVERRGGERRWLHALSFSLISSPASSLILLLTLISSFLYPFVHASMYWCTFLPLLLLLSSPFFIHSLRLVYPAMLKSEAPTPPMLPLTPLLLLLLLLSFTESLLLPSLSLSLLLLCALQLTLPLPLPLLLLLLLLLTLPLLLTDNDRRFTLPLTALPMRNFLLRFSMLFSSPPLPLSLVPSAEPLAGLGLRLRVQGEWFRDVLPSPLLALSVLSSESDLPLLFLLPLPTLFALGDAMRQSVTPSLSLSLPPIPSE